MVSIVIAVYRSQEILPELCRRIEAAFTKLGREYEVIFSVDCSPDDSFGTLKKLAARDKRLRPILLRKNVGYDNAIMAGLNFIRGEWVVLMDDDLQHAPEDIGTLLAAAEAGNDVVYASFPVKRHSGIKNLGSAFNDLVARIIIRKPRAIYLSPFKVIVREVVDEMVKYGGPFPYIDGMLFQITSAIGQIPVEHHPRASGHGNHGILRSARILLNFTTTFSILPLRISIWFGFAVSIVAFLFAACILYIKLTQGVDVEGWVSIVVGIALLSGIQLMSLGIIGEYIGRSYLAINRKPQFVVKETVNC